MPRSLPDFGEVRRQLQTHKHLTLQLVWEEYRESQPDGYGYSRFCELYDRWSRNQDVVLRQEHRAGEKMFVDWAGDTIPLHNQRTGEILPASLFVAVLGASTYTFARATLSQDLGNWVECHVAAFEYCLGTPRLVVPDNLRTGVDRACRYEPDLNRTYHEMALHYGVAIMPARPRKPRDKACASYCTLSRFDSGQDWLGRSSTAVPLCNCGIPKRFIKRVVAAVADDAAKKTGARPFMHRRFGNAKRLAHLFGRQ
jgi:transposase